MAASCPCRRCRPRLARLTDAQLHALLVRVQTLLLDRSQECLALHVDLLCDDEARLLALYRALPPGQRREALAWIEQAIAPPVSHEGR